MATYRRAFPQMERSREDILCEPCDPPKNKGTSKKKRNLQKSAAWKKMAARRGVPSPFGCVWCLVSNITRYSSINETSSDLAADSLSEPGGPQNEKALATGSVDEGLTCNLCGVVFEVNQFDRGSYVLPSAFSHSPPHKPGSSTLCTAQDVADQRAHFRWVNQKARLC